MENRKIRVLIAKPGLDGHETGAKLVSRALRDAGMEVIYTGPRQTPEMIIQSALQEDVDVIGLSILSGSHIEYASRISNLLKEHRIQDIPVIIGGIIPKEEIPLLKEMGIKRVFGPGAKIQEIVDCIEKELPIKKG